MKGTRAGYKAATAGVALTYESFHHEAMVVANKMKLGNQRQSHCGLASKEVSIALLDWAINRFEEFWGRGETHITGRPR